MIRSRLQQRSSEEAAAWVTRLKDSHTLADRRMFEEWLAQDPAHPIAYDHALATFEASGVLRTSRIGRRRNLAAVFPAGRQRLGRNLALASIAGLLLAGAYELNHGFDPLRPVALETVLLSSGDEARSIMLVDGTNVRMAPGSEVRVDLNRNERLVEVRKGRVRLIVARDKRPFRIVAAGRSTKAATGNFDAQVAGDVGSITEHGETPGGAPDTGSGGSASLATAPGRNMVEFSAEPLADAVERINRVHAGPALEVEPKLADLRVTGIFQQGSSETIARSLAVAFDLKLIRTSSGTLRLTQ